MELLDVFALFILLVLLAAIVAAVVALGALPGRIARSRRHPQAEAVTVCGWLGVLTAGVLLPLAYVWAFYDPRWQEREGGGADTTDKAKAKSSEPPAEAAS